MIVSGSLLIRVLKHHATYATHSYDCIICTRVASLCITYAAAQNYNYTHIKLLLIASPSTTINAFKLG